MSIGQNLKAEFNNFDTGNPLGTALFFPVTSLFYFFSHRYESKFKNSFLSGLERIFCYIIVNFILLIAALTCFLVLFLLYRLLEWLTTSTNYGSSALLLIGGLSALILPYLYFAATVGSFKDKTWIFARQINVFQRLLRIIFFVFFALIFLCIGLIGIWVASLSVQSIIKGPVERCLVFDGFTGRKTYDSGTRYTFNNEKPIYRFKYNESDVELSSLKNDYTKVSPGTLVCFQYFEPSNVYVNDQIKQ